MISVSCNFDGGDVAFHDEGPASRARSWDPDFPEPNPTFAHGENHTIDINLLIPDRPGVPRGAWFYFRLQGAAFENCRIRLRPPLRDPESMKRWAGWNAVASHDRINWFRVPTVIEDGELVINHTPLGNSVYYAYFEPYGYERHLNLVGQVQGSGLCQVENVAVSPMGRDVNLLILGNEVESDPRIWIVAREGIAHASASWVMEGMLNKIVDGYDASARSLIGQSTLYVVPLVNPDGAGLGDGGRPADMVATEFWGEWEAAAAEMDVEGDGEAVASTSFSHAPTVAQATTVGAPGSALRPEIDGLLGEMAARGCDLLVVVSSVDGAGGVELSSPNPDVLASLGRHFHLTVGDCPLEIGKAGEPMKGDAVEGDLCESLAASVHYPVLRIKAPSYDNEYLPDDDFGWSGQRSWRLGEDLVDFLRAVTLFGPVGGE